MASSSSSGLWPVGEVSSAGTKWLVFVSEGRAARDGFDLAATDAAAKLFRAQVSRAALAGLVGPGGRPERAEEELRRALLGGTVRLEETRQSLVLRLPDAPKTAEFIALQKVSANVSGQVAELMFRLAGRNRELEKSLSLARAAAEAPPETSHVLIATKNKTPDKPRVDPTKRSVLNPGQAKRRRARGAQFADDEDH